MESAEDLSRATWDVIVIGTGMGGGTLGHALAKRGRRVLFLEKGRSSLRGAADVIRDFQPEVGFDEATIADEARIKEALARGGRFTSMIEDVTAKKPIRFTPFIGQGTGGSSALYGMVCERFFPADFTPRQNFKDAGESTVPEAWPVSYEEMRPWYVEAEKLYRVHGEPDPLRPDDENDHLIASPPLTPANGELFDFFEKQGLHPYKLHVACEYLPECQSCQGYLCPRECKNDAGRMCLEPAIANFGASLLDECDVHSLDGVGTRVKRVLARRRGEGLELRATVVVLAAGALSTPLLLLRSRSAGWPNGLANQHDLVGRNLMRHCIDLHAVWPKWNQRITGQVKEIGLNDFYHAGGCKMGTIQSAGAMPPLALLLNQPGRGARWLRRFERPLHSLWERFLYRGVALAAIMEDLPYHENRVLPGGSEGAHVRIHYRFNDADRRRAKVFRRMVKEMLRTYRPLSFHAGKDNKPIAHVSGGCRFGHDPRTSVLGADNRAHGLDNLYVVDTSFFPSSAGMNPSLTVAANALRVAPLIHSVLP